MFISTKLTIALSALAVVAKSSVVAADVKLRGATPSSSRSLYIPDYETCWSSDCRPGSTCAVVKADVFEEGTCNYSLSNQQGACLPLDDNGDPKAALDGPCVTSQYCEGDDSVCCYMDDDSTKGKCKRMGDCDNVADVANVWLHRIPIQGFSGATIRGGPFVFATPAGTQWDCS